MSLGTGTIIELIILGIFAFFVTLLLVYTIFIKKPSSNNCSNLKSQFPNFKWSDNCDYIQEIASDPTLTTPKNQLFLAKFTESPSLGRPLGANVWYRYRYVRAETGGYSEFSPWTRSPIIAGGIDLPCDPSTGCTDVKVGKDSCKSNLVQLGINEIDYNIASNVYANVHRIAFPSSETSIPPDNATGIIVGMLYPKGNGGWQFVDTSGSPCEIIMCNTDC